MTDDGEPRDEPGRRRRRRWSWAIGATIGVAAMLCARSIVERRPPPQVSFCAGVGLTGPWRVTPEEAFDAWVRRPGTSPSTPTSGWTMASRDDDGATFVPPEQSGSWYERVSVVRDGGVWSVAGACMSAAH